MTVRLNSYLQAVVDDYAASTSTTGTLAVGGSRTGRVDTATDTDWFRVSLTAGTTYRFDGLGASTDSGTLWDPVLALRSGSGALITTDDDGGTGLNASILYTAATSGTYYVSAMAYSGMGSYTVRATALDDHLGSTATSSTLAVGGSRTGAVGTLGDQDWFRITLQAGISYRFDGLGRDTGNGTLADPIVALRNSAGTQLASNDDSGTGLNAALTYTATSTGTYYVSAMGYAGTGSYTVRATALDDFAGSTSTTGSLAIGGARTGVVNTATDQDWFRITLDAGTTYRFDGLGADTGNGTLADPILALRNSSGTQLASNDDSGTGLNAALTYTASTTGTYYVSAMGYAGTGSYTVRATALDDFAGSASTTGTLAIGGSRSGRVDTPTDTDWFRVTLAAGATYRFDGLGSATGSGTLADPVLALRGSTGTLISTDDDSGTGLNASILYTATASGTYYVSAMAYAGTGSYTVRAAMVDDHLGSTASASALAVNGTAAGVVNSVGDQDWFRMTLHAGTTYRFDGLGADTGNGTLADPVLALRNNAGTQLASNDDSGTGLNAALTYTATTTGTYYLAARAFDGTGSYAVRATALDDFAGSTTTTGTLAVGGSRAGRVDTPTDTDWFRVTLAAGATYRFDGLGADTGNGTLGDPVLALRSSSGALITSNDDGGTGLNASILYTATASGTYYVSAMAFEGTGSYTVRATALDDHLGTTATTASLAVGGSRTGVVNAAGDQDWFRITLQGGSTYRFDGLGADSGNGSLADPFVAIRNSAGRQQASNDDSGTGLNAALTYTAPTTGTYYVSAMGYDGSTGSYTVRATEVDPDPMVLAASSTMAYSADLMV